MCMKFMHFHSVLLMYVYEHVLFHSNWSPLGTCVLQIVVHMYLKEYNNICTYTRMLEDLNFFLSIRKTFTSKEYTLYLFYGYYVFIYTYF